jgi:hypothetical protein
VPVSTLGHNASFDAATLTFRHGKRQCRGKSASTALARCLGCGGKALAWKLEGGRNDTFDPATLTFRHRNAKCRESLVTVHCSDGSSARCRRLWTLSPSNLRKAAKRSRTLKQRGGQWSARCLPCYLQRIRGWSPSRDQKLLERIGGLSPEKARALAGGVDDDKRNEIYRKQWRKQYRKGRQSRSAEEADRQGRTMLLRGRDARFSLCLLCGLLVNRRNTARRRWVILGSFHGPCLQAWLRTSGQRPSRRAGTIPEAWRERFRPPPPFRMRGRPTNPKNLAIGYIGLLRRAAGIGLTVAAKNLQVEKQDLASFIAQFRRYAPGNWRRLFPSESSEGNERRQRLAALPASLGDVIHDPRRRAIVSRLRGFGANPSMIAELVGWPEEAISSVA